MSFLGAIPTTILEWVAGIAAFITVTAYIIKMRRRRFEVPFSALWRRVLETKEPSSLWRHLKRLLSLLFMLLIIATVLFAALGPIWGASDRKARNVVILLDASASMKTADAGDKNETPRFDVARQKAKDLIAGMGGGDTAMVMRMDGQTTPLGRFSADAPMLEKEIDGVSATDTPADLHRALGAAADALRDRPNPLIVIVSDGAFPKEQLDQVRWREPQAGAPADLASVDLTGIEVTYIPVGSASENVGIIAFNVRRYVADKAAYEVFIEVENFGEHEVHRTISLLDDNLEIVPDQNRDLDLKPGIPVLQIYPKLPAGTTGHLKARLLVPEGGKPDPFPLDDTAYALLPVRKMMKVLMVTKDNLPLEAAMLTYDNINPEKVTAAEYEKDPSMATKYDAIVFDDYTPADPPPVDAIYFHPDPAKSPVTISRDLHDPHVTDVDPNHPVMRWVGLSDAHFDDTHVFAPSSDKGEIALASMAGDPIIVAKREHGHKYLVCGFSLSGTDLYLRVAFPMMLVNTLDWFAGDDADLITTYATGVRQRVPLDGAADVREATLTSPDGLTKIPTPVVDGLATFYADTVGVWRLNATLPSGAALPTIDLAANLSNPAESTIKPTKDLVLGQKHLKEPEPFPPTHSRDLWIWFLLGAVALLSLEWITYHRRITV
jgi:hypothetical protein